MDKVLKLENGQYDLIETVSYPNGGGWCKLFLCERSAGYYY